MPKTNYVKSWLKSAEDDMDAVEVLKDKKISPNLVCFHAHQAAEKFLKAYLAFYEINVRKVHDLEKLVVDLSEVDNSIKDLSEEASFLTEVYTESRYPGDIPEFSEGEKEKAIKSAEQIKEFILDKINKD